MVGAHAPGFGVSLPQRNALISKMSKKDILWTSSCPYRHCICGWEQGGVENSNSVRNKFQHLSQCVTERRWI